MLFKSFSIGAFLLFASQEVTGKHDEFKVSNDCHRQIQSFPDTKHDRDPKLA